MWSWSLFLEFAGVTGCVPPLVPGLAGGPSSSGIVMTFGSLMSVTVNFGLIPMMHSFHFIERVFHLVVNSLVERSCLTQLENCDSALRTSNSTFRGSSGKLPSCSTTKSRCLITLVLMCGRLCEWG